MKTMSFGQSVLADPCISTTGFHEIEKNNLIQTFSNIALCRTVIIHWNGKFWEIRNSDETRDFLEQVSKPLFHCDTNAVIMGLASYDDIKWQKYPPVFVSFRLKSRLKLGEMIRITFSYRSLSPHYNFSPLLFLGKSPVLADSTSENTVFSVQSLKPANDSLWRTDTLSVIVDERTEGSEWLIVHTTREMGVLSSFCHEMNCNISSEWYYSAKYIILFPSGRYSNYGSTDLKRMLQDVTAGNVLGIEIAAYADTIGTFENNKILSEKRAQYIMQSLMATGLRAELFNEVLGAGETELFSSNESPDRLYLNRCAVVTVKYLKSK